MSESPTSQTRRFNIGDEVYHVVLTSKEHWVPCPSCAGWKALTVIMGDGTKVRVECPECEGNVYEGSRGVVKRSQWAAEIRKGKIGTVAEDGKGGLRYEITIYRTENSHSYHTPERVYATAEEAKGDLEAAVKKRQDEEHATFLAKERPTRSWAWNATHHRRCVAEAERQLAYHRAKLDVAKVRAKELVCDGEVKP